MSWPLAYAFEENYMVNVVWGTSCWYGGVGKNP
uniref:Uncharacterized protein n=1 Tax=Arundo donax TaxID=35708 RepID=A0A0A9BID0_ARUDO